MQVIMHIISRTSRVMGCEGDTWHGSPERADLWVRGHDVGLRGASWWLALVHANAVWGRVESDYLQIPSDKFSPQYLE